MQAQIDSLTKQLADREAGESLNLSSPAIVSFVLVILIRRTWS
jgi:hypothetical protein